MSRGCWPTTYWYAARDAVRITHWRERRFGMSEVSESAARPGGARRERRLFANWALPTQLLVAMIGLAVLPLVLVALTGLRIATDALTDEATGEVRDTTTNLKTQIEDATGKVAQDLLV